MVVGKRDTVDVAGASVLTALVVGLALLGFWAFGFTRPTLFLFGVLPAFVVWGIFHLVSLRKGSETPE